VFLSSVRGRELSSGSARSIAGDPEHARGAAGRDVPSGLGRRMTGAKGTLRRSGCRREFGKDNAVVDVSTRRHALYETIADR
jgi:hypothetical protein